MHKKTILILLVALMAMPVGVFGAQRIGRRARGIFAAGGGAVQPAQVWRLPTLTLGQRHQLMDLQTSFLRDVRNGAGDRRAARRGMRDRYGRLMAEIERIVGSDQMERARSMPEGPLAPEEIVYYPITALPNLSADRRAKIDAAFAAIAEESRDEAATQRRNRRGGDGIDEVDPEELRQRAAQNGARRQRNLAMFEVMDALLTDDQIIEVKSFLPENLRRAGLRERVVYRMPSLTMEQEARARAIFAALEDETTADRARQKALRGEVRESGRGESQDERAELREIQQRISVREKQAYAELEQVLTPEQIKELAAMSPGPPRPVVFTPEAIRSLDLTPEQQRRLQSAMREFRRETGDERQKVQSLRMEIKDGDPQSLEMAGVRDELRKAALVLQDGREMIEQEVVETLTPDQIAQLVRIAMQPKTDRRNRRNAPQE